jgi:hypothetical protein
MMGKIGASIGGAAEFYAIFRVFFEVRPLKNAGKSRKSLASDRNQTMVTATGIPVLQRKTQWLQRK